MSGLDGRVAFDALLACMVVRGRTRRGVKAWALLKGGAAFLLENVLGGWTAEWTRREHPQSFVQSTSAEPESKGVSTAGDVGWRGIESSSSFVIVVPD